MISRWAALQNIRFTRIFIRSEAKKGRAICVSVRFKKILAQLTSGIARRSNSRK